MAERFAREGMKVVLADVEEKPLAEARDGHRDAAAPRPSPSARTCRSGSRSTRSRSGRSRPSARRTSSATTPASGRAGLCWEVSAADWEWVLGVNLWGVVHGIRAFVPRMIAQGEGHVVNTASIAGLISAPGMGPYCATKHAVVAISECLHHDLAMTGAAGK